MIEVYVLELIGDVKIITEGFMAFIPVGGWDPEALGISSARGHHSWFQHI